MTSPNQQLSAIFSAERNLRAAEIELFASHEEKAVVRSLCLAVDEALALPDLDESCMRLERLADLCAQCQGPDIADALIKILDHDVDRVRSEAGSALKDFAFDYYADVARGVERALATGTQERALCELAFLISDIGEPSAVPLLKSFMKHKNPNVVAAAIEAAVELGEPELAGAIGALRGDKRVISLEAFEEETGSTLGELAEEALEALESEDA